MKTLILVRHAQPEIVPTVPAREWHLSLAGRARVPALASELQPYQPKIIIASLEPKATQTGEILAQCLNLPFQTASNLHEHDRTATPFYHQSGFQKLVQEFFERPETLVFGAETAVQALERFRLAIADIQESTPHDVVIVVAHGTVIALYVQWLTGHAGYDLWRTLGLPAFVVLDVVKKTLLEIKNLP